MAEQTIEIIEPKLIVGVDYETYFDKKVSVKTLGNYAYTRHPDFDAYLVAVRSNKPLEGFEPVKSDGGIITGYKFVGNPARCRWDEVAKADEVWSHNAGFDEEVHLSLEERGIIDPSLHPKTWLCSADMVAYLGSARALAKCMKRFFGITVEKAVRNNMSGKRWSEITPEQQQAMIDYADFDVIYMMDYLVKELAHRWPEHERQVSIETREQGRRGVAIDIPGMLAGIDACRRAMAAARVNIPWAPEDPEDNEGILSLPKARAHCTRLGVEAPSTFAKDSPECEAWEEKFGDQIPIVTALRTFRRCNILLKKLLVMQSRLDPQGRMRFTLKYCGAPQTGRWSGDGGFNMQNLTKDPFFFSDVWDLIADKERLEELTKLRKDKQPLPGIAHVIDLRSLLIAGPGKKFIIADLSQIEPRVLNWLVGNWAFLQKVREGFGIYEAFAVAKGKWPAEKKGRLKKEDPKLYAWAKATVLGLGFGCGKAKFIEVARKMAGLIINLAESTEIVDDFRKTEKGITGLWKQLENAMKCHINRDFHMKFPSGRVVTYRDVQFEEDTGNVSAEIVKDEKTLRLSYWGGILTENLVQGTAREVFAAALLRLKAQGTPALWSVHDEVIVEVDKDVDVEVVARIMRQTPGFLKGCPIDCEAEEASHYKK